jgi:excisionase family DNA binding protein
MDRQQSQIPNKISQTYTDQDTLLNIEQTMAVLSCSRGTLYNLISDGEIKPSKIRSSTRFSRSEIERFISERPSELNPKRKERRL